MKVGQGGELYSPEELNHFRYGPSSDSLNDFRYGPSSDSLNDFSRTLTNGDPGG